jgi:hypothetical protein
MSATTAGSPSRFAEEADTFVEIMRELAPGIRLDYTASSVGLLEQFIAQHFDPPGSKYVGESLPVGAGCYLGEVIIRTIGGRWNREGKPEINHIGPIQAIFPIQRAVERFRSGPAESLVLYLQTVAHHAQQGQR